MNNRIFEIKENKALTNDVFEMKLKGDTSDITAPGQFVNIKINGLYLRRPISVCDIYGDELTLIYKVVGKGTEALSNMKYGAKLDILSGLGNGYSLDECGDSPLLIGGGVGVPPLYYLAKKLIAAGRNVKVILGFNRKEEIFYKKEFEDLNRIAGAGENAGSVEAVIATADGSEGVKGFVTDALPEEYSYVYTCGPEPMLKALYKTIKTEAQMSFEERMGCGFGACMGCSCKTITGYKRICKDGPVLYKEEIIWE